MAIPTRKQLIVISGQSNAVGLSTTSQLIGSDAIYNVPYPPVSFRTKMGNNTDPPTFTSYETDSLKPNILAGVPKFGVELSLGRALDAAAPNNWCIAKYALSGTSLANFWLPTRAPFSDASPNPFNQLVTYTQAALLEFNADLGAIIWIQGENDAQSEANANAYAANLQTLWAGLRARLGPFYFFTGILNSNWADGAYGLVVASAQSAFKDNEVKTYSINQDGGALQVDNIHYASRGYLYLGGLYAAAILDAYASPDYIGHHVRGPRNS